MWCTNECWNCEDNTCEHYISKQEIYFKYRKIEYKWNSLREFVTLKEKQKVFGARNGKTLESTMDFVFNMVLDKMNELEREKNDK